MFVDVIIRCQIYFVFLIFVVRANRKNILTTKISRSTVSGHLGMHVWNLLWNLLSSPHTHTYTHTHTCVHTLTHKNGARLFCCLIHVCGIQHGHYVAPPDVLLALLESSYHPNQQYSYCSLLFGCSHCSVRVLSQSWGSIGCSSWVSLEGEAFPF